VSVSFAVPLWTQQHLLVSMAGGIIYLSQTLKVEEHSSVPCSALPVAKL